MWNSGSVAMANLNAALARPDLAGDQPQAGVALGIQRQHRMQQQAAADALANLTQPAPSLGGGLKIDLTRVLDRQHMPAGRRNPGPFAPAREQCAQCHLLVGEKPIILDDLRTMSPRRPPQTGACTRDHAFEQRRPPLSRRRSPNRAKKYCSSNILAPLANRSAHHRITPPRCLGIDNPPGESFRRAKMCASTSAKAGTHTPCPRDRAPSIWPGRNDGTWTATHR